jgi:hypothetical protein
VLFSNKRCRTVFEVGPSLSSCAMRHHAPGSARRQAESLQHAVSG